MLCFFYDDFKEECIKPFLSCCSVLMMGLKVTLLYQFCIVFFMMISASNCFQSALVLYDDHKLNTLICFQVSVFCKWNVSNSLPQEGLYDRFLRSCIHYSFNINCLDRSGVSLNTLDGIYAFMGARTDMHVHILSLHVIWPSLLTWFPLICWSVSLCIISLLKQFRQGLWDVHCACLLDTTFLLMPPFTF